ncbi:MAG: hypothetical protein JJ858_10780 [Rhizobiaceae bacterium]|nr:hypothetical protein [Rhizobiaceae bacterium]
MHTQSQSKHKSLNPHCVQLKPGAKKLPKGTKGFILSDVDDPDILKKVTGSDQALGKQKLRAIQRVSDNALLELLNRKRITQPQFLAGYKYMGAYLVCSGQTGKGIDYARQRVDFASAQLTLTEKQINAQDVIRNANKELAKFGQNQRKDDEAVTRIQKIVGDGFTVTQYCAMILGLKSSKSIAKQMVNLRKDLSVLAKYWGYESGD